MHFGICIALERRFSGQRSHPTLRSLYSRAHACSQFLSDLDIALLPVPLRLRPPPPRVVPVALSTGPPPPALGPCSGPFLRVSTLRLGGDKQRRVDCVLPDPDLPQKQFTSGVGCPKSEGLCLRKKIRNMRVRVKKGQNPGEIWKGEKTLEENVKKTCSGFFQKFPWKTTPSPEVECRARSSSMVPIGQEGPDTDCAPATRPTEVCHQAPPHALRPQAPGVCFHWYLNFIL